MSTQSFAEELLKIFDAAFAVEANRLLAEARNRTGAETYIAGRMDGLSDGALKIKETYRLFVKTEDEASEENRGLY